MDSMKQKFGNESPEDKQKRKKQMVLPNAGTLAICIAMLAVGISYNSEEDCKGKATTFLILGGGIVCATTALKLIAFWTPCECDDKIMDIVSPIADFVHFCVIIWGSIVVFGQYSQWDYVEKTSDHYCAYTPFMFAFVILILQWIFLPFILCCSIMLCCCAFCYKAVDDNDAAAA